MARRKITGESGNVAELQELADAEWRRQQFEASPKDGLSFIERLGAVGRYLDLRKSGGEHAISPG